MTCDTPVTIQSRNQMVERQIRARGIVDQRILEAFQRVPRHVMVPSVREEMAYRDSPLPIGEGQTISQPYIVALMTSLLNPVPSDRVLEIGTGSGYQTAILAELAGEVFSVERLDFLARKSRILLDRMGYRNVTLVTGDGSKGYPEQAPYDKIVVTAHASVIYPAWSQQLLEGGTLVLPLGRTAQQTLVKGIKHRGKLTLEKHGGVVFVPLIEDE